MAFLDSVDKKYHPYIYGAGFLALILIVVSLISSSEKGSRDITFPAVVLTKADYCGHCVRFMPTWEKLSKSGLKTASGVPIKFVKVDSENKALLDKFPPVDGFPTIRYHYTYDSFNNYDGDRSYEDLVRFIKTSEEKKEGYYAASTVASAAPTGTGADPSKGKGTIVMAPGAKTKGMIPASVPTAPQSGVSLTANKASFNMLSDKEYVPPSSIMPPAASRSSRNCNKETKCDYVDYTKKPSSLGSGINPQNQLFYHGGYLPTNLTNRAYPQAQKGGMYLVEHW